MIENTIAYVSQLGWAAKTALFFYSVPVGLWSLGAAEGAVRTAFNGLASTFARRANRPDQSQMYWDQCKKDGGITLSCVALTVISSVPLIGTYWGYDEFRSQCEKYKKDQSGTKKN